MSRWTEGSDIWAVFARQHDFEVAVRQSEPVHATSLATACAQRALPLLSEWAQVANPELASVSTQAIAELWSITAKAGDRVAFQPSQRLPQLFTTLETHLPTPDEETEVLGALEGFESLFTATRSALEPGDTDLVLNAMYASFWARVRSVAVAKLRTQTLGIRVVPGKTYRSAIESSPEAARELALQELLVEVVRTQNRSITQRDLSALTRDAGLA